MSSPKTFEELREDVYAFLDGELSSEERQAYEDLLSNDIEAREYINEIREFESELKSIEICNRDY